MGSKAFLAESVINVTLWNCSWSNEVLHHLVLEKINLILGREPVITILH